jgi:uncharacterized protein (TIGR02147 family)
LIIIYNYTSYREFLCDYYKEQKVVNPSFSYQYFANKAGFKTKTFIPKVMKREKALAKRSTLLIAKAMDLTKKETDYFEAMVNFNNAVNINEKEYYFQKLQFLSKRYKSGIVRENQFTYLAHWYYSAVRELVSTLNWGNNFRILANAVYPKITPKQAEKAVKLLVDLGMIKKMPSGRYIQIKKTITIDDRVNSLAVQKYQKQTMELGILTLENVHNEYRDISTLTTSVSEGDFHRIKEEIKHFRKKIIGIVNSDETKDRVYQINIQFFPLSKIPKNLQN